MSTTAIVKNPYASLEQALEKLKPALAKALPPTMTADRVCRIVLTECRKNPILLECDRMSMFGAIMVACQLGLEVGSHLGEGYLVPFKNRKRNVREVQFIAGYKGLVKLCYQSEQVSSISAEIVHEKDKFEYEKGDNERIVHVPHPDKDRGPAVAYYALIRMKDGGIRRAVMQKWEVDQHRDRFSKDTRDDSVWAKDPDSMSLKTVVRKAAKLAPMSVERPSQALQRAIALDELADAGADQGLAAEVLSEIPSLAPAGALDRMADEAEGEAK